MRLTDLNPRWFGCGTVLIGLTFDCPHCRTQRLGVHFKPAIDPEGWVERGMLMPQGHLEWGRTGDTFETLTLSPSIDASQANMGFEGHWHGFIRNGEVL